MKLRSELEAYFNAGDRPTEGQFQEFLESFRHNFEDADYSFKGVAIPATDPVEGTSNICYIASTAGTYTNFNSLVLISGEVAMLCYTINPSDQIGTWSKITLFYSHGIYATIFGNTMVFNDETIVQKCETNANSPTYQWQKNYVGGTWESISGETAQTITIAHNSTLFVSKTFCIRCKVTDSVGNIYYTDSKTINTIEGL